MICGLLRIGRWMRSLVSAFNAADSGVTAIEYGMIAGLIAVAIIAILTTLGGDLTNVFNSISNAMQ